MKKMFLLAGAVLLFACTTPQKNSVEETVHADSMPANPQEGTIDTTGWSDCVRGIPEPVFDKQEYPSHEFRLYPDKAIESVTLKSGDKLVIEHSGCEYVVMTMIFKTVRWKPIGVNRKNTGEWFARAAEIIRAAANEMDAPLDLEGGANKLEELAGAKDSELNEEYDYGTGVPGDMRQIVQVSEIKEAKDSTMLKITFAIGPL